MILACLLTVILVYLHWQVVMSEEQYQKHAREIKTEHEDPLVEGLYETQVPLLFRALLEIGCVASVNRRPNGFASMETRAFTVAVNLTLLSFQMMLFASFIS